MDSRDQLLEEKGLGTCQHENQVGQNDDSEGERFALEGAPETGLMYTGIAYKFQTDIGVIILCFVFCGLKGEPVKCPFCGKMSYQFSDKFGPHCTNCEAPKPVNYKFFQIGSGVEKYNLAVKLQGTFYISSGVYAYHQAIENAFERHTEVDCETSRRQIAFDEACTHWTVPR